MTEDVFFCDNTKEPPAEGERAKGVRGRKGKKVLVTCSWRGEEKSLSCFCWQV